MMHALPQTAVAHGDEATQVLAGTWANWQFETTDISGMPIKALAIDTAEFFDPGIPASLPATLPARTGASLPGADQITEEEFEQWLDALQGTGTAPGCPADAEEATQLLTVPTQDAPEHLAKLAQVSDIALELIGVRNDLRALNAARTAPGLDQISGRLDMLTRMLWQIAGPACNGSADTRVEDLLHVRLGEQTCALPSRAVITVEALEPARITMLGGRSMLAHATGIIPVVETHFMTGHGAETSAGSGRKIVLVNVRGARQALVVDEVLRHEQALIKPLPRALQQGPWCDGAVISLDGAVSLVLNPDAL
jgi:chemotaxis signal transduction protein